MVDRDTINNNFQNGIRSANANSTVRVSNSVIAGNATGLAIAGGNLRTTLPATNVVRGNGVDGAFNGSDNLQ